MTPFYITYRQDPRLGFEPRPEIDTTGPTIKRIQLINAHNFADRMKQLTELLRSELTYAQTVQEFHEDHPSRPAPAGWTRHEGKRLPPDTNTRNTIAGNSKPKRTRNTPRRS